MPLHEWEYPISERPELVSDKDGVLTYATPEPTEDLTTWIFEEDSFVPVAKLQNGEKFSIFADHLGTPVMAVDNEGKKVWSRELDIYGKTRTETGKSNLVPFLYQGQYFDEEIGLAYNRFRYYSPDSGTYISQDPIGLASGEDNLYAYVWDVNSWIDPLGLSRSPVNGAYKQQPTIPDYQKHHIIPDNLSDHGLLQEIGYDINNERNLVYLPESRNIDSTRTVHNGSHRKWHKQHALAELDRIQAMDTSPEIKRMHVDAYTDKMRNKYLEKDPKVQLNKHH